MPKPVWCHALAASVAFLSAASVFAQDLPAKGAKVSGKVVVGRNALVLPPGEWEVIWTGEGTVGITGDGARSKTARLLFAQRDDASRLRAIVYHTSTLVTTANVGDWNTTACENKNALHRESAGNFKFPECTYVDYWIAPRGRPADTNFVDQAMWDWAQANNLKLPKAFVKAWFVKYQGGDWLQTHVSVNPDSMGLPESVKTDRASSEWNAAQLKGDAQRAAYIEELKKWSGELANNARGTVGGGAPKGDQLPALPQAK